MVLNDITRPIYIYRTPNFPSNFVCQLVLMMVDAGALIDIICAKYIRWNYGFCMSLFKDCNW